MEELHTGTGPQKSEEGQARERWSPGQGLVEDEQGGIWEREWCSELVGSV